MEEYLTMSEIKTENASGKVSKKIRKHKTIMKRNPAGWLVAGLVLAFVVCCLIAVYQMTNSRYVIITVNSASVSKGQNPDGTAFDIYEILSDEVLTAASEKLNGGIHADDLKRHLSVSDALTSETNQQLQQSIRDGEYENVYFPTSYRLTYTIVTDEISLDGITQRVQEYLAGLAGPDMDTILQAVAQSYQDFYAKSYLAYDAMFEIDWERIDAMDYYNRAEAIRTETMRIFRFLQDKVNENPAAGASSVNLTYGDLCNDLWQLISVDIENHQAYIIQNNITTSRDELLRQFRYMEEIHKEEKERRTEEYLILSEAVDMYDSTTTKVVFIPALDQDDSFYMNRTKVGLDYLVESADAARLAADEAEHNAQYYQYLQTCFAEAVTPKRNQIAHADEIYQSIKEQVEVMLESVKLLLEESNQRENEGIKVSGSEMSVGIVGAGMSFAKRFVIFSMVVYVLFYIPSLFKRKKCTASEEV